MGFKTAVLNDVVVSAASPASVKAVLELGKLEETVVVEAATQLVQTQTAAVASTINVKQITNLPLPGRGAFDFVNQSARRRHHGGSTRGATVNGLPQSAGQHHARRHEHPGQLREDLGRHVHARQPAPRRGRGGIGRVGGAATPSDAGQGGVQVRFVTRSGTNQLPGQRLLLPAGRRATTPTPGSTRTATSTAKGAPTAKPVAAQRPAGRSASAARSSRHKAFFFVNYEWISSPGTQHAHADRHEPALRAGASSSTPAGQRGPDGAGGEQGPDRRRSTRWSRRRSPRCGRRMSQGKTINATTDPLTQELVLAAAHRRARRSTRPCASTTTLTSKHRAVGSRLPTTT